jgi:predicted permease
MRRLRAIWLRILGLLRGQPHGEIEAELESHMAMHAEDGVRAGLCQDEARRQARIRLGGAEQVKQAYRERGTLVGLESLFRDVRFALRQLRKAPGFAFSAIVTLALGVGANAAVFSIVEAVLLRPLPYRNPERLVVIWQTDATHRATGGWFDTYREFEAWQQNSGSFEKLAALTWATGGKTILWHEKPIDLVPIPASVDFFSMLGVSAQIGRTFRPSDLTNKCTLVLSHSFWEQKLGAPGEIVEQSMQLGDSPCQVVGVMPRNFSFYPSVAGAWMLITPTSEFARKPWETMTGAFGLLKPGVTRAAAEAELAAIQSRVVPEAPANLSMMRTMVPDVLDLQSNFTWLAGRNLRTALWVLLGAAGLILLIACLNVANLLLGRAIEREREMAVRAALGLGRARLFQQMFTEALLLALAGSVSGVLLAEALLRWFGAVNPVELPPGVAVTLDWRVLLFSAGTGIGSAIVFGLLPAWRESRTDPGTMLKSGSNQGGHASVQRAAQLLVSLQVALSMVLMAGTGLLAESLFKLASTQLGYRTDHLFTAVVHLPEAHYADTNARSRFASAFAQKIAALPGVQAVAFGSNFTPNGESLLSIQGDGNLASHPGSVETQEVSASYFEALDIPLLRGRRFDGRDRSDTQPVAMINEVLAKKYFGGAGPLGHAIKLSRAEDPADPWLTVIGVVANVKTTTVFQEMGYVVEPAVYRPITQSAPASLALMVVAAGSPLDLTSDLQRQLSSIDRDLVLAGIETMQAKHAAELSQPRFRTVLCGGFAALALALAVVGLYGVLSRLVLRRTREIGIRMALGADRDRILRSILRHAAEMAMAGIALGIAGAALAVRLIRGLLYDVHGGGAAEFAAVAAGMLIVAVLAAWRPARHAASIEPMAALRTE